MCKHVCTKLEDPETLLQQVYLDIGFHLGRRGREGLRKLRNNSFELKQNDEGRKYIIMTHNETKKKKQGNEYTSRMHNSERCPYTMEQKHSIRCPISSYEKYMSHRNPNGTMFFQMAQRNFNPKFEDNGTMQGL